MAIFEKQGKITKSSCEKQDAMKKSWLGPDVGGCDLASVTEMDVTPGLMKSNSGVNVAGTPTPGIANIVFGRDHITGEDKV